MLVWHGCKFALHERLAICMFYGNYSMLIESNDLIQSSVIHVTVATESGTDTKKEDKMKTKKQQCNARVRRNDVILAKKIPLIKSFHINL